MVLEARKDSRVLIVEDEFKAFRDGSGAWTTDAPVVRAEELAADFVEVIDSDKGLQAQPGSQGGALVLIFARSAAPGL